MEIQMLKLALIFLTLVVVLWFKRPLYQAMLTTILITALLYGIGPAQMTGLVGDVVTRWTDMAILVALYLITFLQRMLEDRKQIQYAQQDLNGLFNNRRINASIAPIFIGFLPAAAAMILCGDIVKQATDGYLDRKEQGFITTWMRHVPESILPTYTSVLLMLNLSGVDTGAFMLGMIFPSFTMFMLGYLFYLRKIPTDTGIPPSQNKWADFVGLFKHLWSLMLIIVLILGFGLSVVASVLVVILVMVVVYRFRWAELKSMFRRAVETRMLVNTFLVLIFKECINSTGVMNVLPDFLGQFPLPLFMVFALLFFFGGIISGTSGIIALGTTMAFTTIPDAGMPLAVLLMCMCHAACQVSPTHVCLPVVTEYYGITMGDLICKTIPIILIFGALMIGYYQLLLIV